MLMTLKFLKSVDTCTIFCYNFKYADEDATSLLYLLGKNLMSSDFSQWILAVFLISWSVYGESKVK